MGIERSVRADGSEVEVVVYDIPPLPSRDIFKRGSSMHNGKASKQLLTSTNFVAASDIEVWEDGSEDTAKDKVNEAEAHSTIDGGR
jgi:hypothetical protein